MVPIRSPLTGSTNVAPEKEIQCEFLIDHYRRQLGVDVARYFHGVERIRIYKCQDTGFRFYYPFDVDGDGKFYEELQKIPWYYMDWKWEHEIASSIIGAGDRVLEIGCAKGSFLEGIRQKGIEHVGLEFNEHAVNVSCRKGLNILNQSIEDHAKQNPEKYDVVCSFQIVEHIASVKDFIQASVDSLKPGGALIISVPNNDSLIFKCYDGIVLNMPPHHMGLWDVNSLISIQSIFGIRLKRIELEPLQPYHADFAKTYAQRELSLMLSKEYRALAGIINKVGKRLVSYTASKLSKYIVGHTVLAQYTKV